MRQLYLGKHEVSLGNVDFSRVTNFTLGKFLSPSIGDKNLGVVGSNPTEVQEIFSPLWTTFPYLTRAMCSRKLMGFFSTPNPLNPNSQKNEISLYIITSCSDIQVMRIKKVVTKDKLSL